MNTIEAIETRRSIRRYRPEPVDRALIESVVDAARFAPSWKNTQTTRYVVVDSPEVKEQICTDFLPDFNAQTVRSAPVLVALVTVHGRSGYERDGSPTTEKGDRWEYFDAGIACESFCLAAHEKGLGTVILGIYKPELTSFLGLQEGEVLTALVALGYPDEAPTAPKRKSVQDVIRYV
jgi:nitroreductase